jgi:glutamine amidotransferase
LGWLDADTRRFRFPDGAGGLKIPQLGWNDLKRRGDNPLFEGVPEDAAFYFAHSYYVDCREQDAIAATTEYGIEYVSSVRRGNLFGVQFHPEKSHANGLAVVANFVKHCNHA